jgi:hypothetical protein
MTVLDMPARSHARWMRCSDSPDATAAYDQAEIKSLSIGSRCQGSAQYLAPQVRQENPAGGCPPQFAHVVVSWVTGTSKMAAKPFDLVGD